MKIIQVMPFFGLGGAEIMCENLIYELLKLEHEVVAISLYDKESAITQRFKDVGVDIRYLHKKEGLDFSIYRKLRNIFLQEKPDVIHTHLYTTKYVFPIAALLGIKTVHTVHSVATKELSKLSRKFNKLFFIQDSVIPVALSEKIRKTIVEEYSLKPTQIPVVLNGIDLTRCNKKQSYEYFNKFKIVHVGSYQEVKNHIGLIEAFEHLHRKYPDTELHLIGDGPRRVVIEELVASKNLTDCVVFHGFQSNVHDFLCHMDLFTLPSLYEGIPMSIAEAMGTGLPIVATEVGGIPDMLDNNCATLVPVDPLAIAAAFEKYYCSAALRKEHGEAAYVRSRSFSSVTMAAEYVKVYTE